MRGLGGNGKSLLAREYAILFTAAYPGGIFWLNAYGNDDTKGRLDDQSREALRQDQIRDFSVRVAVPVKDLTPEQVETKIIELIYREPFQPFVVEMADGQSLEISHPRLAINGGGAVFFGPDGGLVNFEFKSVRSIRAIKAEAVG